MAYVVTDACVKDFVCVDACSTSAIRPMAGDPGALVATQVYINPDDCIDCGNCADICNNDAIFPEDSLPEGKEQSIAQNRAFFQ